MSHLNLDSARVPVIPGRNGTIVVTTTDNREIVDNGARKKVTFYGIDNKVKKVKCLERVRQLDKDHNQVVILTMPDGSYSKYKVADYRDVVFG